VPVAVPAVREHRVAGVAAGIFKSHTTNPGRY
jgi:hypothetical protein